jgi:flagellar hook protein FlgE
MSINSAMMAGVSGLIANSSALAAISDNIANVNTVAYKRNTTNFQTIVTAQAVPGHYSAGGTEALTRKLVSQQGLIQAANSSTDLAINGDGFFVATTKGMGLQPSDERLFTRSGSFTVDANGYLVNDAGLYLQGWPADQYGNVSPNPSDLTQMSPINVKSLGTAVAPTSLVQISATLNNLTTPNAATLDTYTYATPGPAVPDPWNQANSMANYANDIATGTATGTTTKPDFTMEMNVFDSTGGSHKVALSFLKSATPNQWYAEVYSVPASDVANSTQPGLITGGIVAFNSNGSIDMANTTLFGSAGAAPVINLADSSATPPPGTPQWDPSRGLAAQSITLDLSNLSQLAAPSTLNSVNSDGAGAGNLVSISVDTDGMVSAVFDNGQVRKISQIGVATFPNADGLQAITGGAYRASTAAGVMVIKQPGLGGSGKISPSSLEASTVDLSSEFTGLITTQRAYSASSKIITTADQMLDELIQMKR